MAKTITIQPLTRIEGHAAIGIQLDDNGNVQDAKVNFSPCGDSKNSWRASLPKSCPASSTGSAASAPGCTTWPPTRR
jgi:hypothetical protein